MKNTGLVRLFELNVSLDIGDRFATNRDAVATIAAKEFAAARGNLASKEILLPDALRPVGNQRAMRRSGHRSTELLFLANAM